MPSKKEIESIEKGFKVWKETLEELQKSADKTYMPLLASSLELSVKILETYNKAYKHISEKDAK